jgi:hypothetical protein
MWIVSQNATVHRPSHLMCQCHFTAPRASGVGLSFIEEAWTGGPGSCSFFFTATNGGRIPLLKFSGLERDEGAPCACVARGGVSSIISNAVRNPPFFRPPLPASLQISFANPTNRGAAVGVAKICRRDLRKLLKRPAVRVPVLSERKELFSSRVAMSRN